MNVGNERRKYHELPHLFDKRAIFSAAAHAQKAADYLARLRPDRANRRRLEA
jgi:antirestriction protein ArdC